MTHNDEDQRRRAAPVPSSTRKWLPWIIGGVLVVLALLLLSRCSKRDESADVAATNSAVTTRSAPATVADPIGVSGLDTFLAGAEPLPRAFVFERVHFASASSEIRDGDRPEIVAVAEALKRHPSARIRLNGYADARGSDPANNQLAQARANVVRSALTAAGIDARRIEAVSGGEANDDPTAQGMAENRRTELVVIQR